VYMCVFACVCVCVCVCGRKVLVMCDVCVRVYVGCFGPCASATGTASSV